MTYWEVNFKHRLEDEEGYPYEKKEGPAFFATDEECMAYVLSQKHLKVCGIEMTQRSLGTWKSEITLNAPNKAD